MRVRVKEGRNGFYNEQYRSGKDENGVWSGDEFDIQGPKDFGTWMELINPDDLTDSEKAFFANKEKIVKMASNNDQFSISVGAAQTAFILREEALATREIGLSSVESGLAEREAALVEREEAVAAAEAGMAAAAPKGRK